jgi:hypothetical protein
VNTSPLFRGQRARPCRCQDHQGRSGDHHRAAAADENVSSAPTSINSSRLSIKRTTFSKKLDNVAVSVFKDEIGTAFVELKSVEAVVGEQVREHSAVSGQTERFGASA